MHLDAQTRLAHAGMEADRRAGAGFPLQAGVELYNLVQDPEENENLAEALPDVVALLRERMEAWIARREAETGLENPMLNQGDWHGS
jgi:hypothetical protein